MSKPAQLLLSATGHPREFRASDLPSRLRALVLGPHPDDFDAIAVTLRRLADNGNPLYAAVVRSGSGVLNAYAPDLDWEKKAEMLRFHDTQHQRNLVTRGRGLDGRILGGNRRFAQELSLGEPYVEVFEVHSYSA